MTVKISELPVATEFESGDVIPIVQDGSTKQLDADGNWTFGAIDGTPIGGSTPSTGAFTSVNIDGGNIDGTAIGANSADEGNFTTLHASGNVNFDLGTLFVDASADAVGIGTTSPSYPFHLFRSGSNGTAVFERSGGQAAYVEGQDDKVGFGAIGSTPIVFANNTQERMRIDSGGNVGIGTTAPSEKLSVTGNVTISGSLSKGSGSFKIDHPIKHDTHHLVHSFVEAPQAENIYRGKVALQNGKAVVNLDEAGRMSEGTFEALNCNVQCFTTNEDGWPCVRGGVTGNILTIEAEDNTCTDTVSWMVIGERCDQHMIDANWTDENGRVITEPEKD